MNALERNVDNEPEAHMVTQEEVNEQIEKHIAPLTKQLEELTWSIQGMSTTQHATSSPSACTSTSFSVAGYPPDNIFRLRN